MFENLEKNLAAMGNTNAINKEEVVQECGVYQDGVKLHEELMHASDDTSVRKHNVSEGNDIKEGDTWFEVYEELGDNGQDTIVSAPTLEGAMKAKSELEKENPGKAYGIDKWKMENGESISIPMDEAKMPDAKDEPGTIIKKLLERAKKLNEDEDGPKSETNPEQTYFGTKGNLTYYAEFAKEEDGSITGVKIFDNAGEMVLDAAERGYEMADKAMLVYNIMQDLGMDSLAFQVLLDLGIIEPPKEEEKPAEDEEKEEKPTGEEEPAKEEAPVEDEEKSEEELAKEEEKPNESKVKEAKMPDAKALPDKMIQDLLEKHGLNEEVVTNWTVYLKQGDKVIDQTSTDEKDDQLAMDLFKEFAPKEGYTITPDMTLEWEEGEKEEIEESKLKEKK